MPNPIEIDLLELEKLATLHCTDAEIAAWFNVSRQTIARKKTNDPDFKQAIETGKEKGKLNLRRIQFREAEAGSIPMLIWLGKNLLGQRDEHKIDINLDTCKNNTEKINRVISSVSRGKLTPKDGLMLTNMIRTLNTEEELENIERFKEMEKRIDKLINDKK